MLKNKMKSWVGLGVILNFSIIHAAEDKASSSLVRFAEPRWSLQLPDKCNQIYVIQDRLAELKPYKSCDSVYVPSSRDGWDRDDNLVRYGHDAKLKNKEFHLKIGKIIVYAKEKPGLTLQFSDSQNSLSFSFLCSPHQLSWGPKSNQSIEYNKIFLGPSNLSIREFTTADYIGCPDGAVDYHKRPLKEKKCIENVSKFIRAMLNDQLIDCDTVRIILYCYRKENEDVYKKMTALLPYKLDDTYLLDMNTIVESINKITSTNNDNMLENIKTFLHNRFLFIDSITAPQYNQALRWDLVQHMKAEEGCFDKEIVIYLLQGITDTSLPCYSEAILELINLQSLDNTQTVSIREQYKSRLIKLLEVAHVAPYPDIHAELGLFAKIFMNNGVPTSEGLPERLQDFSNPYAIIFELMDMLRESGLPKQ